MTAFDELRRCALLSSTFLAITACGELDTSSENGTETQTDVSNSVLDAVSWGTNVSISVGTDSFTFSSDGVPDHGVLNAYALFNGSTTSVSSTATSIEIPLQPTLAASSSDTGLGTIGVAISGAVIFNPYEGDGVTSALDDNFDVDGVPFVDSCNGHPLGTGSTYHYHGVPYCITDVVDTPGQHSVIVGFLLDGFPVYGPQDEGGETPTDLDSCSSHFGPTPEYPDGIRHYHMTESAPYSITCYVGEVSGAQGGMEGRGRGRRDAAPRQPSNPGALAIAAPRGTK